MQTRNDNILIAKYNSAIISCNDVIEKDRKFYLKLLNDEEISFDTYSPGENSSLEKTKVELID
jgi:hypothetical protein